MRHEGYYLIKPRDCLIQALSNFDTDEATYILTPQLWRGGEPDRSSWKPEDHIVRAKLLFLARLKQWFDGGHEIEILFNSGKIELETFDQYWTLERYFGIDTEVDEVENELELAVVNDIVEPDVPLIDSWISWLRTKIIQRG